MDHERVSISTCSMSCGVKELSRIGEDTMDVLYALASHLYHPARGAPVAFFIWSDVKNASASAHLAGQINFYQFGTIEHSVYAENPRTSNFINVTTWCINHDRFKLWYIEERIRRVGKAGCS